MPGAAGFIGCPRYATLVRRGGRRAQYQIRYWEATQREGSKAESRAQMQVRVQALVQVGRGTSRIRHRGGGEETRKEAATERRVRRRKRLGGGQSPGESLETDKIANGYLKKPKQKRVLFPTGGGGKWENCSVL